MYVQHLGISVNGQRDLHLKRATTFDGNVVDTIEPQTAGDVYLSPSALINHAPQYPTVEKWQNRIIAMQARLIYETPELKKFRALRTEASWYALVTIIAEVFGAHPLQTPSMSLIDSILQQRQQRNNE